MPIDSTRFGKIEYDKKEIISMARGLMGFDDYQRFIIVSLKGQEPFKWLQSLEDSGLAFLLIDPLFFKPNYVVEINPNDLSIINAKNVDDVTVFVLVSIPEGKPELMSANLLAPLVINKTNMKAVQFVLGESEYVPDHSIFKELERQLSESSAQNNKLN